jgi:hypothetical protein
MAITLKMLSICFRDTSVDVKKISTAIAAIITAFGSLITASHTVAQVRYLPEWFYYYGGLADMIGAR